MNAEEFVSAVKLQTSDGVADGIIRQMEKPSGRKPSEKSLRLSRWYHRLPDSDRHMLREALQHSAESAIFGFFCILDGVRAIEGAGEKGDLELHFIKRGERSLINDPGKEELHNLFQSLRSFE